MDDEGLGDVDSEDKIVLNVGGVTHETLVSTLAKKPGTRLSDLAQQHARGEETETEYYFNRHPRVFNTVIDYYRSGRWTVGRPCRRHSRAVTSDYIRVCCVVLYIKDFPLVYTAWTMCNKLSGKNSRYGKNPPPNHGLGCLEHDAHDD